MEHWQLPGVCGSPTRRSICGSPTDTQEIQMWQPHQPRSLRHRGPSSHTRYVAYRLNTEIDLAPRKGSDSEVRRKLDSAVYVMPGAKVLDDSTITLSDVIASDNRRQHPGSQRQSQTVNQTTPGPHCLQNRTRPTRQPSLRLLTVRDGATSNIHIQRGHTSCSIILITSHSIN